MSETRLDVRLADGSGDMPTGRTTGLDAAALSKEERHARFQEVLSIVCENVAFDWKEFVRNLGASEQDIAEAERCSSEVQEQCMAAIRAWKVGRSRATITRHLIQALRRSKHGRVADLVTKLSYTPRSVEETLAPHMQREGKMKDVLYLVADEVPHHWKHIGLRLGLPRPELTRIDTKYEGRPREKCMEMLYRWRMKVPLQEYKVSSIIGALRESGRADMASVVNDFSVSNKKTQSAPYRRRKGEVPIQISCDEIVMVDWDSVSEYPPTERSDAGTVVSMATSEVSSWASEASTPRIKLSMTSDALKDYALNKSFYRLIDGLEVQDRNGVHPVADYLRFIDMDILLTHASRPGFRLAVHCGSKDAAVRLWQTFKRDGLKRMTEIMVQDDLLAELGVQKVIFKAMIKEEHMNKCLQELS